MRQFLTHFLFGLMYLYEKILTMKKSNTKQNLFEMMEKVNPDFKTALNEEDSCWKGYKQYGMKEKNGKEVPNCVPVNEQQPLEPKLPADVAYLQKATDRSASVKYAASRIDTPQEFQDSFQEWFSTTGFNPQKKPLSISQAQTLVRNAMLKLGYR